MPTDMNEDVWDRFAAPRRSGRLAESSKSLSLWVLIASMTGTAFMK